VNSALYRNHLGLSSTLERHLRGGIAMSVHCWLEVGYEEVPVLQCVIRPKFLNV
jgi:hypothetical protein